MPATITRARSTRRQRETLRIIAATIAASPWPRAVAASNQFQQRQGLARSFCRGSSTSAPSSSASAVTRVPCANSSGVCLQPWQNTSSGARVPRACPRGTYSRNLRRGKTYGAVATNPRQLPAAPVTKRPGAGSRRSSRENQPTTRDQSEGAEVGAAGGMVRVPRGAGARLRCRRPRGPGTADAARRQIRTMSYCSCV